MDAKELIEKLKQMPATGMLKDIITILELQEERVQKLEQECKESYGSHQSGVLNE